MNERNGYLLTLDPSSPRALFSKNVLEQIGFNVIIISPIPHVNKVLSNKRSMQAIYRQIIDSNTEYAYVFEDDINTHEKITLDEIIEYESISDMFFYLGLCEYGPKAKAKPIDKIRNRTVYSKQGFCRGLHAIGVSKKGVQALLDFSMKSQERYMDVILEQFSKIYPANVCRYDLESYIPGHRGILFQDRKRFPSMI
jgi:hypothetical protein